MAPSALRLNPVRARRLCRDTKGKRRVRAADRPPPPRGSAGAAAAARAGAEGARPVVRRSHVGPGACAILRAPPRARRAFSASMEPPAIYSSEYSNQYKNYII